ncbi:UNVERIFIED_ORG: hypothetical protein E4P37_06385 [Bacillus sp. AZ43]
MSTRRATLTAAAMGLVAIALAALSPPLGDMARALAAAQRTVDTEGTDALAVAATGLVAWLVWLWGAVGLCLTAASALPGLLGAAAEFASRAVLPEGARRAAALLLGIGLGVTPVVGAAVVVGAPPAMASPAGTVPDWPTAAPPVPPPPIPDWPTGTATPAADDEHVVVRGDCLWHIAAARLREDTGLPPTDGQVAETAHAWWTANAAVIGPDPDHLLPGQVLRPPGRG